MNKLILSLLLLFSLNSLAQENLKEEILSSIDSLRIKEHVYFLASDSLKGRDTGKKGQKIAANYIAEHFKNYGLSEYNSRDTVNPYFQSMEFIMRGENLSVFWMSRDFIHNYKHFLYAGYNKDSLNKAEKQFYYIPDSTMRVYPGLQIKNSVFCLNADSLRHGLDRALAIHNEDSANAFLLVIPEKEFKELRNIYNCSRDLKLLLTETDGSKSEFGYGCKKIKMLDNKLEHSFFKFCRENKSMEIYVMPKEGFQGFVGKSHAELEAKGLSSTVIQWVKATSRFSPEIKTVSSENVVGYIEGNGKSDEFIVIGAHYDHLGIKEGKIYNGADDNASGTAAIIELAKAFSELKRKGKGIDQTIVFVTFTAEEKGLFGSEAYVRNPLFPLEKTKLMINLDMIGRIDKKNMGDADYVYITGTGRKTKKLKRLFKKIGKKSLMLKVDRTPGLKERFLMKFGSDHYRFAKKDVPIIAFSTGDHKDYHKPTDTAEKLDYSKIEKIVKLVYLGLTSN